MQPKSLYKSFVAQEAFLWNRNKVWAGFRFAGNTNWADYE